MKFTWGTGIAIFFSLFVVFMLWMVYKTSQQDFDLVAEDYYAKEIAFQGVMDKTANYQQLNEEVKLIQKSDALVLSIPTKALKANSSVLLHLFRPSDDLLDKVYEVNGSENPIEVPMNELVQGEYIVKLEWKTDSTSYYFEKELYLK